MRLANRLKKLEAAFPACDAGVLRLAAPDHVPSPADRCPRCGGSHLLVIEEEIVEAAVHSDDDPPRSRVP